AGIAELVPQIETGTIRVLAIFSPKRLPGTLANIPTAKELGYETNIPLSFFSTGQEVPDDIEVANSDFLVRCILEGFNKGKDN
ncbi:hypothetical protein VWN77_10930, partial [Campylobacter coli]